MPGGGYVDPNKFPYASSTLIRLNAAIAVADATITLPEALKSRDPKADATTVVFPKGTPIETADSGFTILTDDAKHTDTTLTIAPNLFTQAIPTGSLIWTKPDGTKDYTAVNKRVLCGTVVSRKATVDDGTGTQIPNPDKSWHLAVTGEDEYNILAYTIMDATEVSDCTLLRPYSALVLKKKNLPNYNTWEDLGNMTTAAGQTVQQYMESRYAVIDR